VVRGSELSPILRPVFLFGGEECIELCAVCSLCLFGVNAGEFDLLAAWPRNDLLVQQFMQPAPPAIHRSGDSK
jgi:hypothetical protein